MKFRSLIASLMFVIAIGAASFTQTGCGVFSSTATTQQILVDNQNVETGLWTAYTTASNTAVALYNVGKITSENWTKNIEPKFQLAHDAIVDYHNAYVAASTQPDALSRSLAAAQSAVSSIAQIIADLSPSGTSTPPPTLPPPAPSPTASTSS